MSDAKHTPLPWSAATRQGSWDWVVCQSSNSNIEVCQMFHDGTELNEVGEANVELILTAVNSHAALMAENAALKKQLVRYQQALRDIVEPVAALKRYADEHDSELDGHLAVQLAKSADHLKGIARAALTDDVREGGK